jgi:hypothetical protein
MRSRDPGPALAAGRDTTVLGYREGRKPYAHDRSGKQATCRVTVSVAAAPRAPGTEAVALCAQAPCGRLGPPGRRPAISAATEPRHAECPIRTPQQMIAKSHSAHIAAGRCAFYSNFSRTVSACRER